MEKTRPIEKEDRISILKKKLKTYGFNEPFNEVNYDLINHIITDFNKLVFSFKSISNEKKSLEEKNKILENEIQTLRQQIESLIDKNTIDNQLETKLNTQLEEKKKLLIEINELKQEISDLKKDKHLFELTIEKNKTSIEFLKIENENYLDKENSYKQKISELLKQNNEIKEEKAKYYDTSVNSEKKIAEFEEKVKILEEKNQNLEKNLEKLTEDKGNIKNLLKEKNKAVRDGEENNNLLRKDLDIINGKLKEVINENENIKKINKDLFNNKNELEKELNELKMKMEELKINNTNLENEHKLINAENENIKFKNHENEKKLYASNCEIQEMDKTIKYLKNILDNNSIIVVGTSGGPDSMCLLALLQNLSINLNIICAHINHNLRKQSTEEYKYVQDYCQKHNIIFEGITIKDKLDKNMESIARKYRYNFFKQLKDKYNAKYIITAHHGDDLIETILMRLTRGSNLSGYAGIKLIDGIYLRPLLFINKNDIYNYLTKHNIKYYVDKTNKEDIHTRNRYRNHILSFLYKENNNIHKQYLKFSNELLEYNNFINNYITNKNLIINNKVNINLLLNEPLIIQKKVIELLIKNIQIDNYLDVSNKNTNNIIKLINSQKNYSTITLNNNFIVKKEYNYLTIIKKEEYPDYYIKFNEYFENDKWIIKKVNIIDINNNYVIRLNSQEIKLPLIIRNRKDKDKMELKNLGTKKVKDIFIDSKVLHSDRNTLPIVIDSDNNILWLPGIKKSKFSKDKSEKYDIILYSERKEI